MALLSVDKVSKRFGKHVALRDVSLTIEPGEFVSLLGPSGCGKTTLLRMIAGFLQADQGTIAIDGQDISALPPHKRPLNTVFQNYALFPHLTVLENVAYGPRRAGAGKTDAGNLAREALALVGLVDLAARYPREMSGGQQQRVALARAIVNKPKLLLLDEPLSALDLQLRKRMQIELKQIQEKIGVAFVFVTHDQEEAMAMSDRIAVMHAGRIEQIGSAAEVYSKPASRFVADFIGEATLLPVNARTLEVLPQGTGTTLAVIRPEHVEVLTTPPTGSNGRIMLDGHIETVVGIGGATTIYVRAAGHLILARRLGLIGTDLTEGQAVTVAFDRVRVHLIEGGQA
jgi:spermidine/putrescine transport system ATP-binding protein